VKDVKKETVPFTPYATMKDGFAIGAFLVIYAWMMFFVPNYLGHPDNYIEANPLVTPPHIVPEWYFLPFYAILRAIPNKLIGVLAMFLSILILAALPWLDKSPVKSGAYRPLFRKFYWVFIAVSVALGYLGAMPAEGVYLWLARIASVYYFLHFVVVLPLLTKYEKPEPVPNSIDETVAEGSPSHA
jgi:ubiquinol-cytochrome c reductase cytochrome b subunit